jgi:hypothetical protein
LFLPLQWDTIRLLRRIWLWFRTWGVIYPLGYDATLTINGNQPVDLSQLVREIGGVEADSPDVFPYLSIGFVYRFQSEIVCAIGWRAGI